MPYLFATTANGSRRSFTPPWIWRASKSLKKRSGLSLVDVSSGGRDALEQAGPVIDGAGFVRECSLAEGLPEVWAAPVALRR